MLSRLEANAQARDLLARALWRMRLSPKFRLSETGR